MIVHLPTFQIAFPQSFFEDLIEHLHLKGTGKEGRYLQEGFLFPKGQNVYNIHKLFEMNRKALGIGFLKKKEKRKGGFLIVSRSEFLVLQKFVR